MTYCIPILLTVHDDGRWSLGNKEHEGNATCGCYELPPGYYVEWHGRPLQIRDRKGSPCTIVTHGCGLPELISKTRREVLREIPRRRS